MALRYLSGKTQVEVAKEIGISQAQVSRLEKTPWHALKESCENETRLPLCGRRV